MKISTRINGKVTSINVKDSIAALHYLICGDEEKDIDHHIMDTCADIITTWEGDTGRGLTGYITDMMVEGLLESNDVPSFRSIMKRLQNG